MVTVGVECYAGHRGEQTPRTLILGDRRVAVAEVLDAWLAPDYRYFKLKGADGDMYLVRHDERSDTWELTMFRGGDRWGLESHPRFPRDDSQQRLLRRPRHRPASD